MTLLRFVDAAFAGAITGGPYDGVCFYLPGGDAFHPWPVADVTARPERYRLPVWVRSNPPAASPVLDARQCLAALHAYGVPPGALVALDSETSVDPVWVASFTGTLNGAFHPVIDYGSESTVFGNRNPDGYYWGADWTDIRHLAAGTDMTQYASFRNQDLDVASPALPFWDTRPAAVPTWTEKTVQQLPELAQGATGDAVRTLQGCLVARRNATAVDGVFGPNTREMVMAVQREARIAADGIVGQQTWPVLLGIA